MMDITGLCIQCGFHMEYIKCKLVCTNCGYFESCNEQIGTDT